MVQVSWYICTIAAAIFFVARIWVRLRKFGNIIIEDGLILLSLCCLVGDLAIQQRMWTLGMADMGNASQEEFVQIMKMIVPGSVLYVAGLWTIKISLVLFYKRIAAPGSKLQMVYNVAIGILVCGFLVIFFHIIFQCFPHDKRWSMDPNCEHFGFGGRTKLTSGRSMRSKECRNQLLDNHSSSVPVFEG